MNRHIIERGHQEYQQVRYLYKDMTQPMLELSLLMGNAYNRELTAWEKTQQAKRLKEALMRAKKEDGLEIPGKLRDIIAGLMNESSSNIAKMESITHNVIPVTGYKGILCRRGCINMKSATDCKGHTGKFLWVPFMQRKTGR